MCKYLYKSIYPYKYLVFVWILLFPNWMVYIF